MEEKRLVPYSTENGVSRTLVSELYFLIGRLLEVGPCQRAAQALKEELEEHGLLPKRVDWTGEEHNQTFEELTRQYVHIRPNHLLNLCRRLGPLVDKEVPSSVNGVSSLLGAGRHSLLRQKDVEKLQFSPFKVLVRQHGRPRLPPITPVPSVVPAVALLQAREYVGSTNLKHVTSSKMYSRIQLFARTLGHLSAVYCVLFDHTGRYIITGADDLLIKIWSALTGRLLATLRGASAEIADLAISQDNALLAAGSCDKIVRVWCLRTTSPIAVLTGHGGMITSIHFSPSNLNSVRYLASTSSDGSIAFWEYTKEITDYTPYPVYKFHPKPHKFNERMRPGQAQMLCASFSPGGLFLAAGCADHHVRVYAMFGPEGPERILELEAHSDRVDSIQWCNQGLRFISGSKDGTALVWRYENREWRWVRLRMTVRLPGQPEPDDETKANKLRVSMVTWSLDDRYVITAVSDLSIKLWDPDTGELVRVLQGHEGEAFVLEKHPEDPDIMLTAGHDGRLIIWDIAKGEALRTFYNFIEGQGHGAVFDAKWSPNGLSIAATDSHGHLSVYGIGGEKFKKLPKALFFHTDYRPLMRDPQHNVLDEQTQVPPHLLPPPFLVDSEGNPYPPHMQRLVPGRENLKEDQLIPTLVYNAQGEQEIVQGLEPQGGGAPRSNIDAMIEQLAQAQERQRQRPRTQSGNSAAVANQDPGSSRSLPLPRPSSSAMATPPRVPPDRQVSASPTPSPVPQAVPPQQTAFNRRVVVAPMENWRHEAQERLLEGYAHEELRIFSHENMISTTDGIPAPSLLISRARGVSDEGWCPSRPRNNIRRPNQIPRSPARARTAPNRPPVSPARQRVPPASPAPRPSQPHGYRTRATRERTEQGGEARRTRGSDTGHDTRRRRRVRLISSEDDHSQNRPNYDESREEEPEIDEERDAEENSRPRNGHLSTSESDSDSEMSGLTSDESDSDNGSSSEYSDWTAEAGTSGANVNLAPPARTTRRRLYRRPKCLSSDDDQQQTHTSSSTLSHVHAAENHAEDEEEMHRPRKRIPKGLSADKIPETFRPSEWLSEVLPRRAPYYPQMGDEVVYFRQGHQLYLNAVKAKQVYHVNDKMLPWHKQAIRHQEWVKIIGIKYELKPPRLCCLKLGIMDPMSGSLTGESFTIKYHDMPDVLDFLILRQTYDAAMQRNWQPGDRFRCIIDDLWWEGIVEAREPYSPEEAPESMFLCYKVKWDNGESERLSPWDLEVIDENRRPDGLGAGVLVLPEEIAAILYQPQVEDWQSGTRDAACDRIAHALGQVMGLAVAEPFVAPVDLNLYPSYAYIVEYPMDLSTIKARLENRFYRRITAVQYDVRYIFTNAAKFNEPGSTIVKHAALITDLCLEVINRTDCEDATAVYHQLVETSRGEEEEHGKPNEPGPSTAPPRLRRYGSQESADGPSSAAGARRQTRAKVQHEETSSTRASARNGRVNWKQQCRTVLEALWRSEDALPFREPVNILDHPDYTQVVDHPIDLGTIREELQVGNYNSPLDFAKDVRLVFENSKNYNTNKKSRIYAMTIRLSAMFEEHFRSVLNSYKSRSSRGQENERERDRDQPRSSKGKRWVSGNTREKRKDRGNTQEAEHRSPLKMVLNRTRGQVSVASSEAGPSTSRGGASVNSIKRKLLGAGDSNSLAQPGPSHLTNGNSPSSATTSRANGLRLRTRGASRHESSDEEELSSLKRKRKNDSVSSRMASDGDSDHSHELGRGKRVKFAKKFASSDSEGPSSRSKGKAWKSNRRTVDDDDEDEHVDENGEAEHANLSSGSKKESSRMVRRTRSSREDGSDDEDMPKLKPSVTASRFENGDESDSDTPLRLRTGRRAAKKEEPLPALDQEGSEDSESDSEESEEGTAEQHLRPTRRKGTTSRQVSSESESESDHDEDGESNSRRRPQRAAAARKKRISDDRDSTSPPPKRVRTRNGGKRTVRYREDSEDEDQRRRNISGEERITRSSRRIEDSDEEQVSVSSRGRVRKATTRYLE